jgi:hypothetical protein
MGDAISNIMIFEEEKEKEYRSLSAGIGDKDNLVVYGVDAGPSVKSSHGDWDYEYWLTVPGKYKDTILLHLMKERFNSFSEIQSWLMNKNIECRRGFM